MIVDAHAHIFPPLAGSCGFSTEAEHRLYLQLYIAHHGEPVHRLRDHAIVPEAATALYDPTQTGPRVVREAGFRVGRFGRFEWEWEGETYYRSFLPPSLQEMGSPTEFLLQSMARAGVDCTILQNARLYGRLNEQFAEAVRQHPDKLIGLADVVEAEVETSAEIARLTTAVRELGLRGVYFANRGLVQEDFRRGFDDPAFDLYWNTVRDLRVPVFWEIAGVPTPTPEAYLQEIERLNRWCERFPDIPSILTHGVPVTHLEGNLPAPIERLLANEQMMVEVLYPIHWGREHDYPYPELRPILETLYQRVGPQRLVWGSDMPNVERNCTYRQSLDYLRPGLAGIASAADLDAILGMNALRLVGVAT